MVKRTGWGLVIVLALGLVGGARAQGGPEAELSKDWDIRAGFFIPEREAMRKAAGDVWFTVGAEHPFYYGERWTGTISLDYYGKEHFHNIPLQVNLRSETQRLRYGAGVGVSWGNGLEKTTTAFAFNVLVGYTLMESTKPITFDVKYMGIAHGKGELNGWGLTIGTRF